jgi:hypothetical protein
MGIDDRSTNVKPQSRAFCLNSKKGVEDPLNILWVQPIARVSAMQLLERISPECLKE